MIFANSLPRIKAFLCAALRKSSDVSCCLLFVSTFVLPAARRSVTTAAGSILEDVRNAGWLLRWLGSSQALQALLAAAQHRLLSEPDCQRHRLHVLAIDSTQHNSAPATGRTPVTTQQIIQANKPHQPMLTAGNLATTLANLAAEWRPRHHCHPQGRKKSPGGTFLWVRHA